MVSKCSALRMVVREPLRESLKGKPVSALLWLVFVSLFLRTGQARLARNPAQGMATVSQLENCPVAQLKSPRLRERRTLDTVHPTSWDLQFLSLGQVISRCSPPSPGNFLSDVLFVGYHLCSPHLCVEELWDRGVGRLFVPHTPLCDTTRGRGKGGEGLTSSASVWGGGCNGRGSSAEASRSCPYLKELEF